MTVCYYNMTVEFFYNNSGKELFHEWRPKDILVVALGLTVSIIVLLTNLLVITAIVINKRFHYPIYYLLGNLAAADLFAGIAYMFLMFHTGPRTAKLSLKTWFIRQSLLDTSLTASVVNLLAIAVERHQTIFTMQLHSKMSNQRVIILIGCIWITALLLGLIPSYGWHCLCQLNDCSTMAPLYSRRYLTFWALSNLFIFLIMVVVYTHIFIYVKRKMARMSKHTTFHPRYKETMINLIKTVIIILTSAPASLPGSTQAVSSLGLIVPPIDYRPFQKARGVSRRAFRRPDSLTGVYRRRKAPADFQRRSGSQRRLRNKLKPQVPRFRPQRQEIQIGQQVSPQGPSRQGRPGRITNGH
ncbi:lysophosphatidic acid receptor 2 isoform X2 [Crotalus tigris]|uniref:lysophosphatidic acid receptor 2 isoform X2 n=1 Tax=Crotalus tigris TaxID=88082 RepID=UPI00192F5663|nr:lysophosphatidic acid receptor 2 isoform X2 [Crotalus tigris]